MRAIIMTLVVAALAAGGYFFYRQGAPQADAPKMFEAAPPSPARTAEDCNAKDAVYEYVDDRRLTMRFRLTPATQEIEVAEVRGRRIGNLAFVVHATSFNEDYAFVPVNEGDAGPMYRVAATYLRPEAGGERFQVSMFDSQMRYLPQLPRDTARAPAFIYMPGALATLYNHRIDQPPGLFRFQSCAEGAPAAP
jgi:hypothetical protein